MDILSNLKQTVYKRSKRRGRGLGSGSGAKSGRGTTRHQVARENVPLHFEGGQNRMVKRFPLLRGKAKNKSIKPKAVIINLDTLEKFEKDSTIDMKSLVEKNIIAEMRPVKVVATGKLTKSLTIALPVSESAKKMIEKAGGKVQ